MTSFICLDKRVDVAETAVNSPARHACDDTTIEKNLAALNGCSENGARRCSGIWSGSRSTIALVLEAEFFVAVSRRAAPTLYAAARGRLIRGAIKPFLADLLLSDESPVEIARKHHVAAVALHASLDHLAGLGLGR